MCSAAAAKSKKWRRELRRHYEQLNRTCAAETLAPPALTATETTACHEAGQSVGRGFSGGWVSLAASVVLLRSNWSYPIYAGICTPVSNQVIRYQRPAAEFTSNENSFSSRGIKHVSRATYVSSSMSLSRQSSLHKPVSLATD